MPQRTQATSSKTPAKRKAATTPAPKQAPSAARQPKTQESRRAAAEERLLNAALEIVAKRGSLRMTLADVGTAAGYSRGLPAHCFGSKEGLLEQLALQIGTHFNTLRRTSPKRTPGLDSLRAGISLYFDANEHHSAYIRAALIMMSEALLDGTGMRAGIATYNLQSLAGLEANIKAGQQKKEIRDDLDPAATAMMIMGAMRGVMLQYLLHDGAELGQLKQLMLDFVDRVVAVRQDAPMARSAAPPP